MYRRALALVAVVAAAAAGDAPAGPYDNPICGTAEGLRARRSSSTAASKPPQAPVEGCGERRDGRARAPTILRL